MVEKIYHGKHQTIPVGKKEYLGSVESFHDRIEDEFYDIETFNSLAEFLGKAWSFILYWNLDRENLELKKTPFRLIKEKCHILNPAIANFQPFILDEMKTLWPDYLQKSVPYVADELSSYIFSKNIKGEDLYGINAFRRYQRTKNKDKYRR